MFHNPFMIPILTRVVLAIPFLFTGALLLEAFFGIPGLGSLTVDAIQSNDFSTYYYGVDSTEALAGWSEYDLDWTVNWQTGVTFRIGLNQNIMLNTVVGVELLDQDIADSPLVERDTRFFGMLGIAYGF